jgi:hypothetical protein
MTAAPSEEIMFQQANASNTAGIQSLSNLELSELEQRLNERVFEAVQAMDSEWKAAQKPILLLGSAAMLMPSAFTLLLLALLLPLNTTQLWTLLVASSLLFYLVVELAWRGHEALPASPLRRLAERFTKPSSSAKAVVQ